MRLNENLEKKMSLDPDLQPMNRHLLIEKIKENIKEMEIFKDFRIEESPSDHVPILTKFTF